MTEILPPSPDTPPPSDDAAASAPSDDGLPSLDEIKAQYGQKIKELVAGKGNLPALVQEIQRLRLARLLLEEARDGEPSEATYRELVLITRMVKTGGKTAEPLPEDAAEDTDEPKEGELTPRRAVNILKVLEQIQRTGIESADDDDDPPPDFEPAE